MSPNQLTITEAHEGLVAKQFSCTELVQSCLDAIERHDNSVRAFVTVTADKALVEAQAVDEKIAAGVEIGLLEGIPYSVKDVVLTEGVLTTASSNMLKSFVAPYDATIIKRLREAGAIIVGKTNCDPFGHGSSTENSDFFISKTPWDTERVAGGSSGGSAASVSAGMCIFSVGEDTGGSIRNPASFCNTTALKESYGRVSRYGSIAYASSFDTLGPITRSALDAGIVTGVIAGLDGSDHTTRPDVVPDYRELLNSPKKYKVGVLKEFLTDELAPSIRSEIDKVIVTLKGLGHEIREVSLPNAAKYAIATYYLLTTAETSSNLERLDGVKYGHRAEAAATLQGLWMNSREEGFGAENKRRIMLGTYALSAGYYDAYYKKAQKVRTLIREDFDKAYNDVDIILSPATPGPAFKPGEKVDPLQMYLEDIFTVPFSLAGVPTMCVPMGFVDKLPVGVQLSGRYMKEEDVLDIAHQYQSATEHHMAKPPLG